MRDARLILPTLAALLLLAGLAILLAVACPRSGSIHPEADAAQRMWPQDSPAAEQANPASPPAPQRASAPAPAADSFQLGVLVLDLHSEQPIADLEVRLRRETDGRAEVQDARTDADGLASFAWTGPTASGALATPGDERHLAAELVLGPAVLAATGRGSDPVLLYLHPRASSAFRIVERDGSPIAGVEVFAPFPGGRFQSGVRVPVLPPGPPLAVSDDEGRFVVGNASGSGSLHLRFPSGSVAMASVTLGGAAERTIRMLGHRRVRVVVRNPVGEPIAGAAVRYGYERVHNGGAPYVRVMLKRGVTDESGEFLLDRVDPGSLGSHALRVEKEGCRPWQDEVPPDAERIGVVLDQGMHVLARIRSEAGLELQEVEVLTWSPDAANAALPPAERRQWQRAERVDAGTYSFPIGSRHKVAAIWVSAAGHASRCLWPQAFDPASAEVDVVLEPERLVRAALDPHGDWEAGAYVLIVSEERALQGLGTTVPGAHDAQPAPFLADTRYTLAPGAERLLRGLRTRFYLYELRDPISDAVLLQGRFHSGDQQLLIPAPERARGEVALAGAVLRAPSGLPFSQAGILCMQEAQGAGVTSHAADARGNWRLDGLLPIPHWLTFQYDGFAPRSMRIKAGSAPAALELRAEILPAVRCKLRFLRKEQHFGGDYYVRVQYPNGDSCPQPPIPSQAGGMPSRAWVDHDGHCTLTLPDAEVLLEFYNGSDSYLGSARCIPRPTAADPIVLEVPF